MRRQSLAAPRDGRYLMQVLEAAKTPRSQTFVFWRTIFLDQVRLLLVEVLIAILGISTVRCSIALSSGRALIQFTDTPKISRKGWIGIVAFGPCAILFAQGAVTPRRAWRKVVY